MGNNVYTLGADFSTQSVKIVLLDIHKNEVVYTSKFDYDRIFPEYKTTGGSLESDIPEIRHTSPYMLIEVLEYMFEKIKKDGFDPSHILAYKAGGMQHCTIYADKSFEEKIKNLDTEWDIINQVRPCITRKTVPIWEDRSPVEQAKILTEKLESQGGIINLTGNKAELRFPAPQIMKWAKESPEEYNNTAHIFLFSAFLTSILAGKITPVDTGDGWGTNLNSLDIKSPGWNKEVLSAVNSYLKDIGLETPLQEKIGGITHYDDVVGKINPYFIKRYGANADAIILAGTGDNPATLLGCGGNIVVSLGSSYTVNGVMKKIIPSKKGEYNIFGYTKGKAMALCCITNGAKLHDYFLKKYIPSSMDKDISISHWREYTKIPGNSILKKDEKLMLPYLFNESVPVCKSGIVREDFDENDVRTNIRALHVSQCLSIRSHSSHLNRVKNICIVGGQSKNPFLRQMVTDVFKAKSYSIKNADFAAPIGCAISGARHLMNISYKKAGKLYMLKDKSTVLKPIRKNVSTIKHLLKRYADLENKHIQQQG